MNVTLETLNCGQCGAPLRVPETAQFVTCNHCQSSLVIRRMESISLTECIKHTETKSEGVESHLAFLVFQNRVAAEQRRWNREQSEFLSKDKSGNFFIPRQVEADLSIVISVVATFFFAIQWGAIFAIFPILCGVVGHSLLRRTYTRYKDARREHLKRLSEIPRPNSETMNNSELLAALEKAPTPAEYLRDLSAEESVT